MYLVRDSEEVPEYGQEMFERATDAAVEKLWNSDTRLSGAIRFVEAALPDLAAERAFADVIGMIADALVESMFMDGV